MIDPSKSFRASYVPLYPRSQFVGAVDAGHTRKLRQLAVVGRLVAAPSTSKTTFAVGYLQFLSRAVKTGTYKTDGRDAAGITAL